MSEAGPERSRKLQNRLIFKFTKFLGEFSAGTILLCILGPAGRFKLPPAQLYHESGEMDLEDLILSGLPQICAIHLRFQPLRTGRSSTNGVSSQDLGFPRARCF